MRIVSLVPGATEILAAIGAADHLVGISHECDYPSAILQLPRVTWTPIDRNAASARIDAQVRAVQGSGQSAIAIDADQLRALRPDLIVTQRLCDVCAVSEDTVHPITDVMQPAPEVFGMSGRTMAGVIYDILCLGEKLGSEDVRNAADRLTARMEERFAAIADRARAQRRGEPPRRVLCLEWLEPIYLAGHWVPELVEYAGGLDVGAEAGAHSRRVTLEELEGYRFDMVFVLPCGFSIARTREELERANGMARWLRDRKVPIVLVEAVAYTSRPGPRLVEGASILAAAISGGRHEAMFEWM